MNLPTPRTKAPTMLAATYTAGSGFAIRDLPVPSPGAGELLVAVTATAVCATDLKIMAHGHRKLTDGQRIVLGHEFVGTITAIGVETSGWTLGQRVGVAPNAGCGACAACIRGQSNYCPDYTAFGIDRDGSHAPYVLIPARFVAQGNVVPLPPGLDDTAACLLEPLSCVVNAVRGLRVEPGERAVVFGAGPMGLLAIMVLRAAGAAQVVAVDPLPERLVRAQACGADQAVAPTAFQGTEAFDLALVACPVPAVQAQALAALAPFGRLSLFAGLAKGSPPVPLDTNAIHYRNLVVTGSTGGAIADYRAALRLAAGRRVDLSGLVAAEFHLDRLAAAYQAAGQAPLGKVVLRAGQDG